MFHSEPNRSNVLQNSPTFSGKCQGKNEWIVDSDWLIVNLKELETLDEVFARCCFGFVVLRMHYLHAFY